MSAAESTDRGGSRLLVVGGDDLFDQVAAQSSQPPVRAADHFEAIGEVAMRSGADRITAVLIDEATLDPDFHAVHALRAIDPTIDLIALHRASGNGSRRTIPAGLFDATIDVPLSSQAVPRTLNALADPVRATDPATMTIQPEAETEPEPESPASAEPEPISSAPGPIESRDQATHQSGEPLGDVDLIDALLTNPRGLRQHALAVIHQYTDQSDLNLVQAKPETPCAQVTYGDVTFGWLTSSSATADELASWANWLGYWFGLERQFRTYQRLAYRDDLTGAWNRRFFFRFLDDTLAMARTHRRAVTLMVFDIDDFKLYNDQFGHHAGDEVLMETVRLLQSVIRTGDRVCRIGGDEFAVIFADPEGPREVGSAHPETVEHIARRFQDQVCKMRFPKLGEQAPGPLSISGGLATYPWDGADANSLLRHADQLALESKRKGKNVITFGPGLQRVC